ncbi:MAG: FeoB-associated Cys-rich membrane protein [Tenuifilaceae bacterium]
MMQEIIVLLIITGAIGYFVYSMYRTFVPKKGKQNGHSCAGCSSDGCNISTK